MRCAPTSQGERSTAIPDDEQFRLITGFNDIFVSIAAAILLFAVGWIGQSIGQSAGLVIGGDGPSFIAPLGVAATSWGLALFFTAKRRMALPSIILLLSFVIGVFAAAGIGLATVVGDEALDNNNLLAGIVVSASGAIAAAAAWFHWRRFRVPITVAAGAAAVASIAVGLLLVRARPGCRQCKECHPRPRPRCSASAIFLFAMWWDGSDRGRLTRRADVAFWLHLLAAPMIVHPVFTLLGLNDGHATIGEGVVVILLYVALGVTALAIDRRALLVSALAYVLFAMQQLFREFGAVELNVALTALVIGSALLMLSAFWHQARAVIVRPLPEGLRDRLPILDRTVLATQPAA